MHRVILWSGLLTLVGHVAFAQSTVQFTIDAKQDVHPISRLIYGVNQLIGDQWTNATFERFGGNRTSEYNWITNASNAGKDWHSVNDDYFQGTAIAAPIAAMLDNAREHDAGSLITVPMIGYVAADEDGDDVHKSGPDYLKMRFHRSMPVKGSPFTLSPDPNGPVVYQDEFVNWVKVNYPYGQTDPNRRIYFVLDNEPDIWAESHEEAHPTKVTYAEMIERTIPYAKAIKKVMPSALVYGPANYGWNGYTTLQDATDADGRDFQEFYLAEMAKAGAAAGKRLIDALDVHYYPDATGGDVRIIEKDSTPAVVAARLQAPRSLWDPDYIETSWITKKTPAPLELITTLQSKIADNYPGTKLAFSEYNYGGGSDISGGIAEADVLGIFGRMGVYSANEWPLMDKEPYIAGGFAMYRDFDGKNGMFGDTSVSAATSDVADTSVYASVDSRNPGRTVLVAINKTGRPIVANMQLKNGKPFNFGEIYLLSRGNAKPVRVGESRINNPGSFKYTMPSYSVSTIELSVR
jgi:Glycoside hydrolase family 44